MTAVSPYAPTARNRFLQHHSSKQFSLQKRLYRSASVALFLLVIRFWNSCAVQRARRVLGVHYLTNSACGKAVDHHGRILWRILYGMAECIMERLQALATEPPLRASCMRDMVHQDEQRLVWKIVYRMAQSAMDRILRLAWPITPLSQRSEQESTSIEAVNGDESGLTVPLGSVRTTERVRTNQRQIRSILNYWFGQYAPETAQKKLWMIASSSVEQRTSVDAEIADQFREIISKLASQQENESTWQEWCHDVDFYGYAGKIASIVALDQFSRHLIRHDGSTKALEEEASSCEGDSCLPSQAHFDALAYETAKLFTEQHAEEIHCGMIPLPMYIFALMPYRHVNTIDSVQYVQGCINNMAKDNKQVDAMIGRFRKATNRRMAVLQDEARRTGAPNRSAVNRQPPLVDFRDEDILQVFPFDADMSSARNHIVCKTIEAFLANRGIILEQRAGRRAAVIIVSLSGGVDSMVIASVLAYLRNECSYNIQIVAIHIDYANRPESKSEADYVRRYCEKHGILFKCRTIDEVTRGETARDDYERSAREARYSMYRETVAECANGDSSVEIGVTLGHHRGDLRENVLSNSHKGCGPLDLSGMTAVSKNDGVVIYRPLLPLEKEQIYDYAHSFGIPYFKDTTPHWSTRGKLRNKLLPLLQEIYGEGSMNNLSSLAAESDEARELLDRTVLSPFLDQVERRPMGITFATGPWRDQGLFFWKFVLREALHSAGLGMFSEKSVIAFLERVQTHIPRSGWLQCRRDYAVYLQEDGRIFVFFPESFPFRKSDQFACAGKAIACGRQNAVSVGPWTVFSEVVSEGEGDDALLDRKAVPSMDDLFNGRISYYLKCPVVYDNDKVLPRSLVFIKEFSRQNRPRAWKHIDLKIQSTLPLLGNDETAMKELAEGAFRLLVKISLMLEPTDRRKA